MTTYPECKCIDKNLQSHLQDAINCLKNSKLGDITTIQNEREKKLREPLEALDKLSSILPAEQIKAMRDSILKSVPVSEDEKLFVDLDNFLKSCTCDETTHIDWRKFPYGAVAEAKAGGTRKPFAKKVANLPTEELANITGKILGYNKRFKSVLDDPVTEVYFKNKYGSEKDITAGNVRGALVELGIMSAEERKEWYELNKKLIDAGGPDLVFRADNEFLNIRKLKGLIVTPKSEAFGKKKR